MPLFFSIEAFFHVHSYFTEGGVCLVITVKILQLFKLHICEARYENLRYPSKKTFNTEFKALFAIMLNLTITTPERISSYLVNAILQ